MLARQGLVRRGARERDRARRQDKLWSRGIGTSWSCSIWSATAESLLHTAEWIWLYKRFGYTGDYEFPISSELRLEAPGSVWRAWRQTSVRGQDDQIARDWAVRARYGFYVPLVRTTSRSKHVSFELLDEEGACSPSSAVVVYQDSFTYLHEVAYLREGRGRILVAHSTSSKIQSERIMNQTPKKKMHSVTAALTINV
jgi:hypothetical protein